MPPADGETSRHLARNNWRDDRDLLEEIASVIDRIDTPYDRLNQGVRCFREWVKNFRSHGYDQCHEAIVLATWVRERVADVTRREGSCDLTTRPISFPVDLDAVVRQRRNESKALETSPPNSDSILQQLIPDSKLRNFALERIRSIFNGNVTEYLHSLVRRDREFIQNHGQRISDLLGACRQQLDEKKLEFSQNFSPSQTDFWIPEINLGIEVVFDWDSSKEFELTRVLGDTAYRLEARSLVVVTPNDMPDHQFHAIKKIEEGGAFENLSVIRLNALESYLEDIVARTR
ncbi:MAG: hypothetical protein VCA18_05785 [Opitutales bacterium]